MRTLFSITTVNGSILYASNSFRDVLAYCDVLSLPVECITAIEVKEV